MAVGYAIPVTAVVVAAALGIAGWIVAGAVQSDARCTDACLADRAVYAYRRDSADRCICERRGTYFAADGGTDGRRQ